MAIQGIGTEIVECLRIAQLIEKYGEQFIHRTFGSAEIDLCNASKAAMQQYAGIWAGKLATLEALGISQLPGVRPRDVEINRDQRGIYSVTLRGVTRDAVPSWRQLDLFISISHCRTHAVAHVVVERLR